MAALRVKKLQHAQSGLEAKVLSQKQDEQRLGRTRLPNFQFADLGCCGWAFDFQVWQKCGQVVLKRPAVLISATLAGRMRFLF